jgi:hypothetical protein
MEDSTFVILHRGPKGDVKYGPQSKVTSLRQMDALCDLHRCKYTETAENGATTYHVHADAYYTRSAK